ncbi:hypothetical protein B296_00005371 [Ensete ventricosum]|uniref:Uncharacterized protein n=1 Tax=Ensete ventricosum TaxID=4639 RepID=A0A427B650_ENSVE|nr:hypothetical protein B296_00005371 [Ensete ventricosum]
MLVRLPCATVLLYHFASRQQSSATPMLFPVSISSCAFGPSLLSTIAHPSSGGMAPDDSKAIEALATIRSCFNVDLNLMACRLVELASSARSGSMAPSTAVVPSPPTVDPPSLVKKR